MAMPAMLARGDRDCRSNRLHRHLASLLCSYRPLRRSLGRDVCPELNHMGLFFGTPKTQVCRTVELDDQLRSRE